MSGWINLPHYNSLFVVILGLYSAIGFCGFGVAILDLINIKLRSPWLQPMGLLTGLTVFSILVQILAMTGFSTKAMLILILFITNCVGIIWLYFIRERIQWVPQLFPVSQKEDEYQLLNTALKAIIIMISIWLLISSAAPSTRHDETAYHIIVGYRIVADQSLLAYRMPMEATVFPHLFFQIAQAPFHALGYPDAGGTLSCAMLIMLSWFLYYMVLSYSGDKTLALLTWIVIISQPAAINFLITVGPHAFGFLAVTLSFYLLWERNSIISDYGHREFLILITMASIAAVSSRLFMLPLALVLITIAYGLRVYERKFTIFDVVFPSALWLIVFGPIVSWLWFNTGSPLGILTAEIFNTNYFGQEAISSYNATRNIFKQNFMYRYEIALWSVSLWLGILFYIILKDKFNKKKFVLTILFTQSIFIFLFMPWELRHLTGLQFAIFALGMISLSLITVKRKKAAIIVVLGLSLPWLIINAAFAYNLGRVGLGLENKLDFLNRYSALFKDYQALDKVLPENAVILVGRSKTNIKQMGWLARPPIFYSPRKTVAHHKEIPKGQEEIYLLYLKASGVAEADETPLDPWLPNGFEFGELVYKNPQAIFYPSRSGFGGDGIACLEVYRLVKIMKYDVK
ncbi:MAG: hypothetical protein EKK68_10635 [Candidatus Competibacteraceae bacterium]|nr:MAG: hypothetical protein EKK68_10635 [Candidatus Competibacteraceae bacterium]